MMTNMSLNSLSKDSYTKMSNSYNLTKSVDNFPKVKTKLSPNRKKEAPMNIILQPYDVVSSFNQSKFSKASLMSKQISQSSAEKITMAA